MAIDYNTLLQTMVGGPNPFGGGAFAPSGPTGGAGPQPSTGNAAMNFLQSPGGSSIISAILGGVGAMGQARSNERMNAQQMQLAQQQMQLGAMQGQQQDRLARDQGLLTAAPTGWAQNYEQNTLLKNIMLQNLLNGGMSLTPTNEAVKAKLDALGPSFKASVPEEWNTVNPFGVDQTMQALAQRQGVLDLYSGGRAPGLDFGALGYDPEKAKTLNDQTNQYRQFAAQQYDQPNQQLLEAIGLQRNGANQQPPVAPEGYEYDKNGQLKKKGGGFWGALGKGLMIGGAGLATALSGGAASPLLAAAIGAGAGAAGGALQGGGLKGALLGAAGGAVPGVGGALTKGVTSGIGRSLINTGLSQGAGMLNNAALTTGQHQQYPGQMPTTLTPYQQPYNPYIRQGVR